MLFVKTVKTSSIDAAYIDHLLGGVDDRHPALWDLQPYTKRGAIKGLLPHEPHNLGDILATHILKQTGSYEQAS